MRPITVLLAFFVTGASLHAQAPNARRIAIYPFAEINSSRPQQIGQKLCDRLLSKLADSGAYQIIDRQFLQQVMKEQDLPRDRFDPSSAVKLGKLLNVAAVVDGTITTFTMNGHSSEDAGAVYGTVTLAATARLISTETGTILRAPTTNESSRGVMRVKQQQAPQRPCITVLGRVVCTPQAAPSGQGVETKTMEQLLDEAMEACARDLAAAIAAGSTSVQLSSPAPDRPTDTVNPDQATVIGVSEGLTYINKGSNARLSVGQVLQVYRMAEVPGLTDPDSGKPLIKRTQVCTLTLSDVEETNSSGKCTGNLPFSRDIADLRGQSVKPPANSPDVPENSCANLASKALTLMQTAPVRWKSGLSLPLQQIQAQGLDAYVRMRGGIDALLAETRRDLRQSTADQDDFGINLNRTWVDLLVCMSREPRIGQLGPPKEPWADDGVTGPVFKTGDGVTAPVVIYKIDPGYTLAASSARLSGTVELYLVVASDGSPRNIRVTKGLGMGLDENAVEAVRKWRFRPGMKDGEPVNVGANIQVSFRI